MLRSLRRFRLIYPGICPCSSSSSRKANQKSCFPEQGRWDQLTGVPVMDEGEFWFWTDPSEVGQVPKPCLGSVAVMNGAGGVGGLPAGLG